MPSGTDSQLVMPGQFNGDCRYCECGDIHRLIEHGRAIASTREIAGAQPRGWPGWSVLWLCATTLMIGWVIGFVSADGVRAWMR